MPIICHIIATTIFSGTGSYNSNLFHIWNSSLVHRKLIASLPDNLETEDPKV